MKKVLFVLGLSFFVTANYAQTAPAKKEMSVPVLKDHVCTDACKSGTHMFAHGEKGHVCTDECKKIDGKMAMPLKDHVCTADCHDGQHLLAHGEKGHVCGEECKKMMDEKTTTPLKDHVCTKDCKDNKHSFAHGRRGMFVQMPVRNRCRSVSVRFTTPVCW